MGVPAPCVFWPNMIEEPIMQPSCTLNAKYHLYCGHKLPSVESEQHTVKEFKCLLIYTSEENMQV